MEFVNEQRILCLLVLGLQCLALSLIILVTFWQWVWTILALGCFGFVIKFIGEERKTDE